MCVFDMGLSGALKKNKAAWIGSGGVRVEFIVDITSEQGLYREVAQECLCKSTPGLHTITTKSLRKDLPCSF